MGKVVGAHGREAHEALKQGAKKGDATGRQQMAAWRERSLLKALLRGRTPIACFAVAGVAQSQ